MYLHIVPQHETHTLSSESLSRCSARLSACDLEVRNALEIHHLQHLIGLGVDFNNVLKCDEGRVSFLMAVCPAALLTRLPVQ